MLTGMLMMAVVQKPELIAKKIDGPLCFPVIQPSSLEIIAWREA